MSSLILYLALFLGLVPFMVLVSKKRAFDIQQPVVPFVWLTAAAVAYELIGTLILERATAYWFHLYDLLEFIALYYFFYRTLQGRYKPLFYIFAVLFALAYLASSLQWEQFNALKTTSLNTIPTVIFVLSCSGLWFKKLFDKADVPSLWQNTEFYFVAGFIIYYSGTFFLFLLGNLIFSSASLYFYDYWFINVLATLFLRIFMVVGIWKMKPG